MRKLRTLRLSKRKLADAVNALYVLQKARHKEVTLTEVAEYYALREPAPAGSNIALLSLCRRFFKTLTKDQERTRGSYRSLFRHLLRTLDPRTRVLLLSEKDIDLVLAPYTNPVSYTSVLRRLNTLFKWGVRKKLMDRNPAGDIKFPQEKYSEPAYFMPDKVESILSAVRSHAPRDIRIFFILGFYAGLRTAEILRMRWGDINLAEKFVRVALPKGITCGVKPRIVELEPKAVALLRECCFHMEAPESETGDALLQYLLSVIFNTTEIQPDTQPVTQAERDAKRVLF